MSDDVKIREAIATDSPAIALLCQQLSYSVTIEQIRERLDAIQRSDRHALFVCDRANSGVIGWVHVYLSQLLLTEQFAEIGGLIVDRTTRRRGIGRQLMQKAEYWAREKRCSAVLLGSNIVREEAHQFYARLGYDRIKTSLTFRKNF